MHQWINGWHLQSCIAGELLAVCHCQLMSLNISAKKPKMKAGAGAEELNVGVGGRGIFSNRTSVVKNWLP